MFAFVVLLLKHNPSKVMAFACMGALYQMSGLFMSCKLIFRISFYKFLNNKKTP